MSMTNNEDKELLFRDDLHQFRHEDYVTAIELVKEGKVQLIPLQSKVFPFGQYQQAYEYIDANRETTMKVLIDVQDTTGIEL